MPTTVNKQRLLNQLFTMLKKHYGDAGAPERPVLEQMIFAILREGATREDAERAYEAPRECFFDWNEVRVSTVQEVSETLAAVPEAGTRAKKIIEFLQELFEMTYSFHTKHFHPTTSPRR